MKSSTATALVTGAATRIGRVIARRLAADGWTVVVHYNSSSDQAEEVVQDIAAAGGQATALSADLSNESAVISLIQDAVSAVGPLSCLVNNASVFEDDTIDTMTRASWDLHMETNLRAPLVLAQEFHRQLPKGSQGNIINLLDQRVKKLTPQFLSYTLSKSALATLTQTLAQAMAPAVRVNAIAPGPTLKNKRQREGDFAKQVDATLLKRATDPEEIADAVSFILQSPAMTGQIIALDGGQHLIWQTPDVTGVRE